MKPHDDVVAVLPGTVVFAGTNSMNGNYVVIRHDNVPDPDDFSRTTTLFSVSMHLGSLSVETAAMVVEGQKIGTTGSTGNSTGEHLHFQIDRSTAPFHPYWPFTSAEASAAGYGFFAAVNAGLGLDKARSNTVNPLVYLDRVAGLGGVAPSLGSVITASTPTASNVVVATADTAIDPISSSRTDTSSDVVIAPIGSVADSSEHDTLVSSSGFSDVPDSHSYHHAIVSLKDRGIVSGTNGRFYPDNNVSRVELLKMVFLAGNIATDGTPGSSFSDVDVGAWYAPYVATAKARGIVGGYEDGTFRPNNPVTRAEALKIIIGTLAPGMSSGMGVSAPFADIEIGAWYAQYAEFADKKDLMHFSDSLFRADKFMTRGEVASVVSGLM